MTPWCLKWTMTRLCRKSERAATHDHDVRSPSSTQVAQNRGAARAWPVRYTDKAPRQPQKAGSHKARQHFDAAQVSTERVFTSKNEQVFVQLRAAPPFQPVRGLSTFARLELVALFAVSFVQLHRGLQFDMASTMSPCKYWCVSTAPFLTYGLVVFLVCVRGQRGIVPPSAQLPTAALVSNFATWFDEPTQLPVGRWHLGQKPAREQQLPNFETPRRLLHTRASNVCHTGRHCHAQSLAKKHRRNSAYGATR